MTTPLPDIQLAAVTAGREAVRAKLNGLFSGQVGLNVADELADAAMAPLLAEVERQRALITRHHDALDAVMAMDDDVTARVSLGGIARTYVRALTAKES